VWDATATVLNNGYENGPVAPGTAYWRTNTLWPPVVHNGTYYFTLNADANNQLIESIGVPQQHGFHQNHAFSGRKRRVNAPVSLRLLVEPQ
jgi:hypothetical protein